MRGEARSLLDATITRLDQVRARLSDQAAGAGPSEPRSLATE